MFLLGLIQQRRCFQLLYFDLIVQSLSLPSIHSAEISQPYYFLIFLLQLIFVLVYLGKLLFKSLIE
jgi:hypothetical protein